MIYENWKEFKFNEIFDIYSGFFNKKPPSSDNGIIPFIGATFFNNGVTDFYTLEDIKNYSKQGELEDPSLDGKLFVGNCITVTNNGSVGYAFYQTKPFTCSQDVNVLYLKNYKLNKCLASFLILMIEQQRVCFNYSRKWTPARMKKSSIMLPINENNELNYEFMENYINELRNNEFKKYIDIIKKRKNRLIYKRLRPLNHKKWESFYIDELFTISSGKRLTKSNMIPGDTPFIGATALNNGVTNFVSNINDSLDSNVLGVNYNGSVVESFYHPYNCLFTDDVKRFHLKYYPDNKHILLFFKTILLKQKEKYMYGYKFNSKRMKRQSIIVPINDEGKPDYEYMEQYMINLEILMLDKYLDYIKK